MTPRILITAALLLAIPLRAEAQPSQVELARAELLRQAEDARSRGDHAGALDFATRAGSIRMHPSVRLMLAQEHNALGHVLDALASASQCAREAQIDTALNNRERILGACTALAASLNTRVGHVIVEVPSPPVPALRVRVMGNELMGALFGVAYPVLPGRVSVDADAEGHAGFHEEFSIAAGERHAVHVRLARSAVATVVTPLRTRQPPPPPETERVWAGPLTLVSLGAASFVTAGVFYGLRGAALTDRDATIATVSSQCDADANRCDYAEALRMDSTARTYNLVTNVTLGVGAAAVVAGTLWYLLAPRRTVPRVAWFVAPQRDGLAIGFGGAL